MKYLLNVVETYRVDTVDEALEMRDEMSVNGVYELQSFRYTTKYDKKHDEEYQVVKVKKSVNSEKEPTRKVEINYEYKNKQNDIQER